MPVNSSTEYWIKPDALTINLNHFGDPDYLQVSVLAGAVVMAFKQDVIGYNAAHNYRTWPLDAANTYLETTSAYNVYARLTRSEVNARALVVYDTVLRDIEGREITYAEDGSEVLGDANPDYFFVFLGQISASVNSGGSSVQREWIADFRFGNLNTNQYQNEEAGGEWTKMFRLNKVTDMIDVLKTFSSAIFRQLSFKQGETEKIITDVKLSTDSEDDVPISDETIPTTKQVQESTEQKFLRKDKDDTAKGVITFEKQIKSKDFVQGNLMGAGWSIYKDANGNTVIETDKIVVRQELEANEIVVNQETFEKGSSIYTKGGCTIIKVEEYDNYYRCYYDNENGNRYSGFKRGDQARCQRYDTSYAQIIKYYWRLVEFIGDDFVDLSKTDYDGSGIPEVGDDIAQLGNRYDKSRQSAIEISPDNGGRVVIWAGIDSYNLTEKNMIGMGVNPNTGRSYIYGYGDMYFGDRNLEKNFITYQIKDGETEPSLFIDADIRLGAGSEGLSNLEEFKDVQDSVKDLMVDFSVIKSQADKEFTIWYFAPEPTLDNEPAVNWTSDELKREHDQDLYFSDELARAWRFVDGQWVEITDERTLAVLKFAEEANKAAQEAKVVATEIKTYIDGVLPTELENLQKQIDGTIESYFYKYEPSSDNEPASLWDTDEKKEAHLSDTFTNLSDGRSWRWSKDGEEYKWVEITDTATVEALRKAGEAQDTADSKRRVFVDTPYPPYEIGDLWVQGESGDILRCSVRKKKEESYADSDWIKASKYTDDSALTTFIEGDYKKQLEELKTQIDSRAETWYQDTDPSLEWDTDELKELHIGDLWYDTTKDQSFMWNGTEWVTQGVPDDVFDKIDGKAEIFVSQPTEYNVNDLWILAEDTTLDKEYKAGTIVIATQTSDTFVASHWTKKDSYTDDTEADKANARLDSWASDGVISPLEKTALIQQKYDIQSEYAELIASAVRYEISYTSFNDAYRSATTALNKYTAKNPENITVGDDYANIALYYTERQELKKAIDSAIKTEADNTYTIAMEAEGKAQTLTESIDDVVQNMEIIKAQTDMEYTIWYFDDEPTLSNEPAINWTTSELKELHDQDLYFSDSLGRAWRFVDGAWVEITDERSIVALREAAEANNRVSDLEYLKGAFGSDERVLSGGVVMSKVVSVANDSNEIEAFLNGSDFAQDSEHGKLLLAGGIPSEGENLEDRAKNAATKMYEDGTFYSEKGVFDNALINGTLRTPWKVIEYKLIYSSSDGDVFGYDGSAVNDDKVIISPVITAELLISWGSNADGRDIAVRVNAVNNSSVYILVPSGYFAVGYDGTKVSEGEKLILNNGYVYYLSGFSDCWLVKQRVMLNV